MRVHVVPVRTPTVEFPELLERKIDLAFARLATDPVQGRLSEELDVEVLFNDDTASSSARIAGGRGARSDLRTWWMHPGS